MPQIDFYVLSQAEPDARARQACRIAEQAAEQGQRVYMQTASANDTQRLDELLWMYHDRSFLPHEVVGPGTPSHEKIKVLIGHEGVPAHHRELVINLTEAVPGGFDSRDRIAEIVDTDPERKRTARERFKVYRAQGSNPETHTL
jgi:DNA polymerase-3 subunit chi